MDAGCFQDVHQSRFSSGAGDQRCTAWGSSSIREKLYDSVLYAMLSGRFLGFAVGPAYAIG
jgi:hypothetical protein